MKNNSKVIGMVIGILLFALLMAGITYAWYSWSTNSDEETLIATEVGVVTVKYDAGPNIIGKELNPVNDKTLGIIKGITVKSDSQNVNKTVFDLYLDINRLDEGLKHSSFKYELYKSKNLVTYGSFDNLITKECNNDSNIQHIVLLSEEEITTELSNYVLYIWIDGTVDNPSTMQKQNFEFSLHAVGKNAIVEEALHPDITGVQEGTLAYKIVNDYLTSENKTLVLNNNIKYYYDTTNNLMSDIAGNVRYYGNANNNYIYFNCDEYPETGCETWRIIGVFEDKVKLIRGEALPFNLVFDNKPGYGTAASGYGSSSWSDARLMMLLNPGYDVDEFDINGKLLNQHNRSYYWNSEGNVDNPVKCYSGNSNSTISCYFNDIGITTATKTNNLIADNLYYLGGFNDSLSNYSDVLYKTERSTNVRVNRPSTWIGKIALIYPSDYGYARNLTSNTTSWTNWLSNIVTRNNTITGRLISPMNKYTGGDYTAYVRQNILDVYLNYGLLVNNGTGVTPTLYLKADTAISNVGDGSSDSPYRIIINE